MKDIFFKNILKIFITAYIITKENFDFRSDLMKFIALFMSFLTVIINLLGSTFYK